MVVGEWLGYSKCIHLLNLNLHIRTFFRVLSIPLCFHQKYPIIDTMVYMVKRKAVGIMSLMKNSGTLIALTVVHTNQCSMNRRAVIHVPMILRAVIMPSKMGTGESV